MKKLFTLIALFICAFAVSAQRNVDWEVVEFISPDRLESNTQSGTEFRIKAVLKNNGPDTVYSADTLLYQMVLRSGSNQVIAAVPNGSFNARLVGQDVNPGDTMHFTTPNYRITSYPNSSVNLKLELNSRVVNRGGSNPLDLEPTNETNNIHSVDIVWYNPQGWGVGIEDRNVSEMIEINPNPATDVVNVGWIVSSTTSPITNIEVIDITGRSVISKEVDTRLSSYELNTTDLVGGVYSVTVSSGNHTFTKKLVISK